MATRIVDIAARAEVSASTVSLALNDRGTLSEDTRAQIKKIAAELGYMPRKPHSAAAKEPLWAAGKSICFLHIARHGHTVNRDHDVFIADYIEGLGQGARAHGLAMEVISFQSTPVELIVESACSNEATGIVVLGTELSSANIEAFSRVEKPLVFIDTCNEYLDFDFVDMNNEDSVHTIIAHLYAKGHRHIGIVRSAIETRNFKLRDEGFSSSLSYFSLKRNEKLNFSVEPTFHGACKDMGEALRAGHALPEALFCVNDIIACGCLKALTEAGLRVPEDISLVGFDDLPLSSVVDPPLTTIQVSKARIGQMAVELLAARMAAGSESPPVKVLIGGKLVVRTSVRTLNNNGAQP